ncbi:MAG: nucleotide exchange factor GrpE [Candidatus Marinimicrobia bacterium]|nr:nucleotide exchange factor GrpE [Candidatus Neomarinimicrobiota bacterium]|tara:strand:+ start:53027 stop:53584 length:558 start_codon:yes stop_codon:yes gene_type:complete
MCADKVKNTSNDDIKQNGVQKKKDTMKSKPKAKDKKPGLKEQIGVLEDKYLRLKAEFDNFRRRKDKEVIQYLEYDGLQFIENILPIVDDFDRMLHATEKSDKGGNQDSIKEGAEMVYQKLVRFLADSEVKSFGETGEILNADLHDAMMTKTEVKRKDGEILEVFEKGYRYKDKVIRHAKVIVNKK